MSEQPGRHSDQFNLRLPNGMRDRLKASAEANKRSMNAEIVARLEESLDGLFIADPDASRLIGSLFSALKKSIDDDAPASVDIEFLKPGKRKG